MFPSLQVFESVRTGENTSFALVVQLVSDISKMMVCARQSVIKDVLDTFCVVTVDILDVQLGLPLNTRMEIARTLIAETSQYDSEFGPMRTTGEF